MNARRISQEYKNGVEEFLQFARENGKPIKRAYYCPCVCCLNQIRQKVGEIRDHLFIFGIVKSYTIWTWRGEILDIPTMSTTENFEGMDDNLEDMIRDVGEENFERVHVYDTLKSDDKSSTKLLELLKEMLPEDNTLPNRNYEAKKILCPMGLEYKKIHTCLNDCVLYTNDFATLKVCLTCGLSRFKKKTDGSSADSPQWKRIDETFPEFGAESRNLRIGLATNGMNPYGNLCSKHGSWPVLLFIYNLPHWLCMKRKYIMLSIMISRSQQPGNDIDVYLSPLIDDLKMLWETGVEVFDAYREEKFTVRPMLFCTIKDFPAYGNLSGYSVKGHYACPICEENTSYTQLKHGQKTAYTRHRKFLVRSHPYRRLKKAFNGCQEDELP
uniref:Transposase-associated domain-containing protein n=1 Tax=Cajanus cajan TaxID=3821 RepID=A0A151RLE7_CAJCA|nr:hypothetical protein KK1_035209 [Cajanus cajan]